MGYEVEIKLDFWLKESDPEWDDYDENVLWYLEEELSGHVAGKKLGFGDHTFGFGCTEVDYREGCHVTSFPPDFKQCWLFYQLAYDSLLDLRDLLRIGSIWADLVITEQRVIRVE